MDRLFSPWRYGYVSNASEPVSGCVFCSASAAESDPLVIHQMALDFAVMHYSELFDGAEGDESPAIVPLAQI